MSFVVIGAGARGHPVGLTPTRGLEGKSTLIGRGDRPLTNAPPCQTYLLGDNGRLERLYRRPGNFIPGHGI